MQNKSQSDNEKKAASRLFDPFNDRLSRDIRNSLSDALVASLKQRKAEVYLEQSREWFEKELVTFYTEYIRDRIRRYDLALQHIRHSQIADARVAGSNFMESWTFFRSS